MSTRLKNLAETLLCKTHPTNTALGKLAVHASVAIINLNVIISLTHKLGIKGFTLRGVETEKPTLGVTDRSHDSSVNSFHMHNIM